MGVPGTNPTQPGTVIPLPLTKVALDRAINKDTGHTLIFRGKTNQRGVIGAPDTLNSVGRGVHQYRLCEIFAFATR